MAAPARSAIFRIGGTLIQSPTSFATPSSTTYGGTVLGACKNVYLRDTTRGFDVEAAEFGGEVIESIHGGGNWVLGCRMRALGDNDVLSFAFWNTSTGGGSGDKVVDHPGTIRAGYGLASRGSKLLWRADDYDTHPSVLLYNAVPLLEESERINLSSIREAYLPMIFLGLRDSSDRIGQIGKIEDLTI